MNHILVIRLSAMGDMAMTIPVVYSVARRHPDIQFTILTRERFTRMLINAPGNVDSIGFDPARYEGLRGLSRLFSELKAYHFDGVADLHDVVRSKYLRLRFLLVSGVRVRHIRKGRWQKRRLTSSVFRSHRQLPSSFDRYAEVFRRLGLDVEYDFTSLFDEATPDYASLPEWVGMKAGGEQWIGIAPFAKFQGKIYPLEQMEKVVGSLSVRPGIRVFLFGFGPEETPVLESWEARYSGVVSCAGRLNAMQELVLMQQLDVMVSMDSANMHLASLVGTRVVSVWGATHPAAGFLGWKQSADDAVQADISCRPCSVFGNKPCRRGDMACMSRIEPEQIVARVLSGRGV